MEWHFDVLIKDFPDGTEPLEKAAEIQAILNEHLPEGSVWSVTIIT